MLIIPARGRLRQEAQKLEDTLSPGKTKQNQTKTNQPEMDPGEIKGMVSGDQGFLSYIANPRPSWAIWDPVSKEQKPQAGSLLGVIYCVRALDTKLLGSDR